MNRNNFNNTTTRRRRRNTTSRPGTRVSGTILVNRNNNPPIHRTITFYPDKERLTMRYNTTVQLTGAAAVVQVYRGSSVYDPDRSGAGSQPLYYDQLSTIYGKYCVVGSRISIALVNGNTVMSNVNVFPSKDFSFAGAMYDRNQQQRASYGIISTNAGGAGQCYLETFDNTARIYGLDDVTDGDDYCALVGANPTIGWYFLVAAQSFDGSVVNLYATVTIDYDVIWSQRNSLYDV